MRQEGEQNDKEKQNSQKYISLLIRSEHDFKKTLFGIFYQTSLIMTVHRENARSIIPASQA